MEQGRDPGWMLMLPSWLEMWLTLPSQKQAPAGVRTLTLPMQKQGLWAWMTLPLQKQMLEDWRTLMVPVQEQGLQ